MRILLPTPEAIAEAAALLRAGQVVGMPTETVYGLAGAAFDPEALARIFEAKERPTFDPLIVHIGGPVRGLQAGPESRPAESLDSEHVTGHVTKEATRNGIDKSTLTPPPNVIDHLEKLHLIDRPALGAAREHTIEALAAKFWPGPLTLVLPKHSSVPDLATSGLPTVAIRMPRHPVAQALITAAGMPLAAPSANRFGRISPTTASHVDAELGDRVAITLDGGPSEVGLESTVVTIDPDGSTRILRPGGVTEAQIREALVGLSVSAKTDSRSKNGSAGSLTVAVGTAAPAPGMLESHYAPEKPLGMLPSSALTMRPNTGTLNPELANRLGETKPSDKIGVLAFAGDPRQIEAHFSKLFGRAVYARVLSPSGDLREAAQNLFATLRALDDSDCAILLAEPCPSHEGLGHAIADRLKRAAAKRG